MVGWIEWLTSGHVAIIIILGLALAAIGLVIFPIWTNQVEKRRVRRYIQSHGGTVQSLRRTNRWAVDVSAGRGNGPGPSWQADPTTPSFLAHWTDRHGVERQNTFVTAYYRRSVWAPEPIEDSQELSPELEASARENQHLREAISRLRDERIRERMERRDRERRASRS